MDIEKLAMEFSRLLAIEQGFVESGNRDAFCAWLHNYYLPEECIKSLELPDREPDAVTRQPGDDPGVVYRWYWVDDCVLGFNWPDGDIHVVIPDDAEPPPITDYHVPWVPGREQETNGVTV